MTCITDFMGTDYRDRYYQHPSDSDLWLQLFQMASEIEPLASTLMYIRNTGAVLVPSEKFGHVIRPVIGPEGWSSREEYERESALIRKHGAAVVGMLGRLK